MALSAISNTKDEFSISPNLAVCEINIKKRDNVSRLKTSNPNAHNIFTKRLSSIS